MKELTPQEQSALRQMMSGQDYDAAGIPELHVLLHRAHDLCYEYNRLRPSQSEERDLLIRRLLGSAGSQVNILQPFQCDYGFNIRVGENFFANMNMVVLDEATVTFGDNVFVGPNCAFYTAVHPIDAERRNSNLQSSLPITVGDNVWLGGNVVVLPGVTIGAGSVIGAGAVVTHDIPSGVVAAGNPCRVLRNVEDNKDR